MAIARPTAPEPQGHAGAEPVEDPVPAEADATPVEEAQTESDLVYEDAADIEAQDEIVEGFASDDAHAPEHKA